MNYATVIIIGGGPAGAACAWKLKQYGIDCVILDKQQFPRTKLCAGWITPAVLQDLELDAGAYPHRLMVFNHIDVHYKFARFKIKGPQYAIRRIEFDRWLLERSGCKVVHHRGNKIRKEGDDYIIDDQFRCRFLVGAGGTYCPVYRTFFQERQPRRPEYRLVTLEQEFPFAYQDNRCHLWFFDHNLPGYSWYVPKGDGVLNVGLGGMAQKLKKQGTTIQHHWHLFVQKLERLALVADYDFAPRGAMYYVRDGVTTPQSGHAFLLGDAMGLATPDMGEGIGPAIKSGILAAAAIANGSVYSLDSIPKTSGLVTSFAIKTGRWLQNFFENRE